MSARRGPNVTVNGVYVYKPEAGPLASERSGSIWVRTSTDKWLRWDELRDAEQAAIIGSLEAMGLSFRSMAMAVHGRAPWPHVGTPWSVWIPNNLYKQVLNKQKGARP